MATRRQVIASAGTILAGGAVVSASSGTASAQTDIDLDVPESVEFDSEEGRLRYLRVSPDYDVRYEGFTEDAQGALVRLYATVGGKTRKLSKADDNTANGTDGDISGTLPEADLVHIFGDDAFTTGTTVVRFRLEVQFGNGNEGKETAKVRVKVNQSGNTSSVDVGGSLSFDGEGA